MHVWEQLYNEVWCNMKFGLSMMAVQKYLLSIVSTMMLER